MDVCNDIFIVITFSFYLLIHSPLRSTLFPYTTLFRSLLDHRIVEFCWSLPRHFKIRGRQGKWLLRQALYRRVPTELRSEEHTSELQSRENLVCRLLLEKKKIKILYK